MDYQHLISDCVKQIPPSGIRKYFDLLDDSHISLGVGEPDFPTPDRIRKYVAERLKNERVPYSSNSGDPHLRELIVRFLDERYGISGYESIENVLITVGASQAIDLAMRAILNPGDEVIVHEPCYVSYKPAVELAGGTAVAVSTKHEDRFRLLTQPEWSPESTEAFNPYFQVEYDNFCPTPEMTASLSWWAGQPIYAEAAGQRWTLRF